ncbi:MAG: DUF4162 domain-containing protein, partial [Metallosphaera sp.]
TGMRKKVEITMALLNSPEVIFMDEPTIGLDVNTRASLWNLVREINKDYQVTILLSTHYMEEADFLCTKIGIINKGKIIALGSPDELKAKFGGDIIEIELKEGNMKLNIDNATITNNKIRIKVDNAEYKIVDIIKQIGDNNIKGIKINKSSLDTVFINLTGGTMDEQDFDPRKFYAMIRRARR